MKFTSLREAARHAGVSYQAIRQWILEYHIGEMVEGRYHIDRDALERVMAARAVIAQAKADIRKSA